MIVRLIEVLIRTVYQTDWRFDNLPLTLSKRHSMSSQTVLLRTTLTRTILLHRFLMWLLDLIHLQCSPISKVFPLTESHWSRQNYSIQNQFIIMYRLSHSHRWRTKFHTFLAIFSCESVLANAHIAVFLVQWDALAIVLTRPAETRRLWIKERTFIKLSILVIEFFFPEHRLSGSIPTLYLMVKLHVMSSAAKFKRFRREAKYFWPVKMPTGLSCRFSFHNAQIMLSE